MHEVLIDMVRRRPALVTDLMAGTLMTPLPEFREARLVPGDFTEVAPTEYRADQVVALHGNGADPIAAMVFEVQLSPDRDKRRSWPVYVTTAHARLGAPASLVVMCVDRAMARWCARPIKIGNPDFVLTPIVIGPDEVPLVDDPDEARANPELAMLSGLFHKNREDLTPGLTATVAGLDKIDRSQAKLYVDLLWKTLPAVGRKCLERIMTIAAEQGNEFAGYFDETFARGKAAGEVEGKAEGEAKGRADAVLVVLATRGIEVSDEHRDRIATCTDIARLDEWLARAVTATSIEDVLA
jgi:hypothetical protein